MGYVLGRHQPHGRHRLRRGGTYDYVYYAKEYPDCPANFYYVMTEDGGLWTIVVLTFDDGESYVVDYDRLGSVPGIRLTGVSGITAGQYASMVYDPVTGYLMLSSYMEGEENNLYAIHPETLLATNLGSFGEKVWPVVSMYQYERATELTVKLNMTAADMDGNDSLNLTAKVVPAAYQKGVTWSTSNPSVATVDENGVVTAVPRECRYYRNLCGSKCLRHAATATCNVTVRGWPQSMQTGKCRSSAWGPVRFLPAWFLSGTSPSCRTTGGCNARSCQRIWRFCKLHWHGPNGFHWRDC